MGVSYAGYYAYACGTSYLKSEKDEALQRWVQKVFWDHKRRYGARRISEELSGQGIKVGRYRVRRLMRQQGLRAIQPRSFVPRTTVSDNRKVSPNLLASISPAGPKAVLVGDITYLPLLCGKWCYLASWRHKVSKRVAGWSISDRRTEDLLIGHSTKRLRVALSPKTRSFTRTEAANTLQRLFVNCYLNEAYGN